MRFQIRTKLSNISRQFCFENKTFTDIEVMLSPASTVQSLSTERKKELVSLIVAGIDGQNLRGLDGNRRGVGEKGRDVGENLRGVDEQLQIQADFISTKGTVTSKRGQSSDGFLIHNAVASFPANF
jgi:hypothetical protein